MINTICHTFNRYRSDRYHSRLPFNKIRSFSSGILLLSNDIVNEQFKGIIPNVNTQSKSGITFFDFEIDQLYTSYFTQVIASRLRNNSD